MVQHSGMLALKLHRLTIYIKSELIADHFPLISSERNGLKSCNLPVRPDYLRNQIHWIGVTQISAKRLTKLSSRLARS